MKTHRK